VTVRRSFVGIATLSPLSKAVSDQLYGVEASPVLFVIVYMI
jgi:hypothetical protein